MGIKGGNALPQIGQGHVFEFLRSGATNATQREANPQHDCLATHLLMQQV